MGKAEAAFWLAAILNRKKLATTALLANDLLKHPPKVPKLHEVREAIVASPREASHWVALVLGKLFEASAILSMIEDGLGMARGFKGSRDFIFGLRAFVTARISPTERARWRANLTPTIRPDDFPAPGKSADPYTPLSPQFIISIVLGFHDELLAALQAIPDNTYTTHFNLDWQDAYHMPQLLLFGLNNPADILAQRRRLGLKLHKPHYLTAWLATTEYAGLEDAATAIIDCNNKDEAIALARVLAKVHAPTNAGPMLAVALKSKAGIVATEWFANNKEHARVGLTSVAKGKGALAEAAKQRLQELGSSLDGKPIAKLPVMPSPAWFSDTAIDKKTAKAIAWLDTTILPDLDIAGHRLSPEHVRALIGQLVTADFAAAPQAVAEVTARATATSRDAFAWRLFQAWQEHGANAKEKWAFAAIGLIGADQCARKLAPLVRTWPGESQHQRAVLGLDVLGRIGTDVALMMLNGIAQKVKFKALQERAREKMAEIAAHRGMTAEQLADRLVPDLDLEDDGSKTLDFGPRSFKVGFDEALKPFVIDAAGTKLSELPKPNSKDDASIASAASEVWKAMKKDVRALAAIQILRLELSMANSRRWVGHEFKAFFVEHPLMIHLVKRVVWGVFDGASARAALISSLRVAEDRSFCDAHDNSYALSDDAIVGIAHPLMLTPASLARWRRLFTDYELIQPFEQLTRACFTLTPDELAQASLNRFAGRTVETKRVLALLNAGWRKGSPQDAGQIGEVYKPIRPGLSATLPLEQGLNASGMEYVDPSQTLGAIEFSRDETTWWQRKDLFTLSEVDPISLSEVIRDIERLGPVE